MKRQSQQGIALVITLILLSVITFMAVTFLVVSRHEVEQVDTTTQQNVAKFGAIGIEQQAESQIMANMMGSRNGYNIPLLVSTNYVSPYFTNGSSSPYNVNYFDQNRNPLNASDQAIMLTNLLFLPRAPVFVTNALLHTNDFRFYHDLNGNGRYDTNGQVTNLDINGNPLTPLVASIQVGDPEWIGFLEHPDRAHSSSNFFLSRGAFIAIPIGNSLDINFMHNQAKFLSGMSPTTYEGFLRNEGIGTWEINFAAFLQTLNNGNNFWGGSNTYQTGLNYNSQSPAFFDAASIMQYRYNGTYQNLNSFQNLYGPNAVASFTNDFLDGYTAGPLLTGINLPTVDFDAQFHLSPWSGSDNPIQIVRPRDLLISIPALPTQNPVNNSFTNRLYSAGTNLDTYDEYTFYRMLAQMGMGSAPEPAPYPIGGGYHPVITQIVSTQPAIAIGGRNQMSYGTIPEPYPYPNGHKMNLNYVNVNGVSATNYIPWTPVQFFTNAADRLLRFYYPTNFAIQINGQTVVTNININFIPIYPVNYYTPGVHRLLQLAANMYDASLNKSTNVAPDNFDYPSVFRPYFGVAGSGANTVAYITGYTEQGRVVGATIANHAFLSAPLDLRRDLSQLVQNTQNGVNSINNVYGVPYVIGARQGFPNFNQFSMAPVVQITRYIQIRRTSPNAPQSSWLTNVAYEIGISNVMAVQCWNSYTNFYGRPVNIYVTNDFSLLLTNNFNAQPAPINLVMGSTTPIATWAAGYYANTLVSSSFQFPLTSNLLVLPNQYVQVSPPAYGPTNGQPIWNPVTSQLLRTQPQPDWGLLITNRLRVIMTDAASGRIIDYVQLGGLGQLAGLDDTNNDIATNLFSLNYPGPGLTNVWNPYPMSSANPLPIGFYVQYQYSTISNMQPVIGTSVFNSQSFSVSGFNQWLQGSNSSPSIQMRTIPTSYEKLHTWSVNDPLVHYMVGDLTDLMQAQTPTNGLQILTAPNSNTLASVLYPTNWVNPYYNNGFKSPRYMPWGTQHYNPNLFPQILSDYLEYIDPQITNSSMWQFPTNKYPNVGWLGRVHRGTPWQTVYLKSHSAVFNTNSWVFWTGNINNDWPNTQPINDWQLMDLFTAAPNDNASRGQLSVNQGNAAAWAAVLDGVLVVSNSPTGLTNLPPIDTTQPVAQNIINGINSYRATLTNQSYVFTSMGQILGVPLLTTASPYINTTNNPNNDTNLTDAVYERIPQQIMGLLRVGTPRYAIFAYGQALKPANNSIVQSGPSFGMPTNYQITGEVLTKSVVRFDNMPVPGQLPPGSATNYYLPVINSTTPKYAIVTNIVPPVRSVVESFQILGPDQ
jgi:hypothetical protein